MEFRKDIPWHPLSLAGKMEIYASFSENFGSIPYFSPGWPFTLVKSDTLLAFPAVTSPELKMQGIFVPPAIRAVSSARIHPALFLVTKIEERTQ